MLNIEEFQDTDLLWQSSVSVTCFMVELTYM